MKNIGEKLGQFAVHGIKPGETSPSNKKLLTDKVIENTWKVILIYPEDFDFVFPLELARIDSLLNRIDAPVSMLIGSTAQDFAKKAWQAIYDISGTVSAWVFTDNLQKNLSLSDKFIDTDLPKHRILVVVNPEDMIEFVQADHLDITHTIFGQIKN